MRLAYPIFCPRSNMCTKVQFPWRTYLQKTHRRNMVVGWRVMVSAYKQESRVLFKKSFFVVLSKDLMHAASRIAFMSWHVSTASAMTAKGATSGRLNSKFIPQVGISPGMTRSFHEQEVSNSSASWREYASGEVHSCSGIYDAPESLPHVGHILKYGRARDIIGNFHDRFLLVVVVSPREPNSFLHTLDQIIQKKQAFRRNIL